MSVVGSIGRPTAPGLRRFGILFALLVLSGAAAAIPRQEKATFEAHLDRASYATGGAVRLAGVMAIDEGWHTNSHEPTFEYLIPTTATITLPDGWPTAVVAYPAGEMKTFAFEEQPLSVYEGELSLHAEWSVPAGIPSGDYPIEAALRYQACDDRSCLPPVTTAIELTLTVGAEGAASDHPAFAATAAGEDRPGDGTAAPTPGGRSLPVVLLLALLGGLILNAMPCVLPVLSLKALGLVKSAGQSRRAVTTASLATSAGIVLSFLALAVAAIVAQRAGAAVGWGVQFQEPAFVAGLAIAVTLFCLNLWGLFEIQLPSRLSTAAGSVSRPGHTGHFLSGLFATLMATPCSAPFLGTAVGFALSQSAVTIVLIFLAIGLGMSTPYLLLAVVPAAADWLPKPGAWMERVKGTMGFLLAAAAIWLLYVLAAQVSPERLAFVQLGLLSLALCLWLRHKSTAGGFRRVALLAATLVIAGTVWTATSGAEVAVAERAPHGVIEWNPFDPAVAESLAAEGRLVFVDVTADWCFTCKVNERLVLETEPVAAAFRQSDVLAMQADWTNRNDAIADFLAQYGRSGIPFYMLYRPNREPHVFGELITKEGLISVIEEASSHRTASRFDGAG